MHHISLETDWWALSNASSIVQTWSAIHEILADKAFIATDGLISQSFVVTFVHPTHMRIASFGAFQCNLVCENWFTSCGDTSWMKFVTLTKFFCVKQYQFLFSIKLLDLSYNNSRFLACMEYTTIKWQCILVQENTTSS